MRLINKTLKINENEAQLNGYVIDNSPEIDAKKRRPAIVICPGGSYVMTSDREAEPVALSLLRYGYHVFVLRYSTKVLYPIALQQLAMTIQFLREHADEYMINPNQITVMGMSAGGHLAASLGVSWNQTELTQMGFEKEMIKPNLMALCYPVITAGKHGHQKSFDQLVGKGNPRQHLSIETRVTKDFPPTFMWHTFDDATVGIENSILMLQALQKNGVSTEYHVFEHGKHGISLANEQSAKKDDPRYVDQHVAKWIDLFHDWMQAHYLR